MPSAVLVVVRSYGCAERTQKNTIDGTLHSHMEKKGRSLTRWALGERQNVPATCLTSDAGDREVRDEAVDAAAVDGHNMMSLASDGEDNTAAIDLTAAKGAAATPT